MSSYSEKEKNSNLNSTSSPSIKQFVIQVEEKFFSKVENHIRVLQYLNKDKKKVSKKEWVAKAIEEKLDREHELNIKNLPKERNINVFLEEAIHDRLDRQVSLLKKFIGISKKQLIIEAISEKLEREAVIVDTLSSKLKDSFQNQHSKN